MSFRSVYAVVFALFGIALTSPESVAQNRLWIEANKPTVGVISGSVGGTYARFAQDMADALDEDGILRIVAILGRGSQQNLLDLLYLKGVDVAIVQSDVLAIASQQQGDVNLGDKIRYVMKLYNEEVHLLAAEGINTLRDLENDGRPVAFGPSGSGTHMTSVNLFNSLDIDVQTVNLPNTEAVAGVVSGELAGALFVVGRPANYFSDIPPSSKVTFLPLEIDRNLEALGYISASLTPQDYRGLLDAPIETIAVGAVMAAYNWKPTSSRHDRVKVFVESLVAALPRLQRDSAFHRKWGEVDPRLEVPGWQRLESARAIISGY
ncbi:TAXI family TRAP transporter solute-binding subunit [Acuticoccus sp. I52.16.1]|uniref:TAXI family TRAP transporter solute-binding subunit n=1 Tax=Acuticoccus sp. I52.16.1 TaxID=2928472 RepID=UPI001FD49F8F|nr:TAXI family TRAP transporter solute-binding subunit [Acuticoccus sp. I52.16.1]UOM36890.1 TAXI family TRAP transporter solute-binding subunit [Acuticoccus sp. I52.16.1]